MNKFRLHEKVVAVPLMRRVGIGKLINELGSIKTKCGEDLSKTRLKLLWVEVSGVNRAAQGHVRVSSTRPKVSSAALAEVTTLIKNLELWYAVIDGEQNRDLGCEMATTCFSSGN